MATHKLPVAEAARVAAYHAAVQALQGEPALRTLNILWRLPDSPDFGRQPPTDRITVRVEVVRGATTAIATAPNRTRVFECQPTLRVGVFVPGKLWANTGNVWGAIEQVILGLDGEAIAEVADAIAPDFTSPEEGYAWGEFPLTLYLER